MHYPALKPLLTFLLTALLTAVNAQNELEITPSKIQLATDCCEQKIMLTNTTQDTLIYCVKILGVPQGKLPENAGVELYNEDGTKLSHTFKLPPHSSKAVTVKMKNTAALNKNFSLCFRSAELRVFPKENDEKKQCRSGSRSDDLHLIPNFGTTVRVILNRS